MNTPLRPPLEPRWTPVEYRQKPRDFDPIVADEVLDRISNGETLGLICKTSLAMPLPGTFLRWCEQDPALATRYAEARRIGTDVNFDAALEEASRGPIPNQTLVKTLQWHAERSVPEKYGPRSTLRLADNKEPSDAGFDYGAEVRRKIEDMAARREAARAAAAAGNTGGADGAGKGAG